MFQSRDGMEESSRIRRMEDKLSSHSLTDDVNFKR